MYIITASPEQKSLKVAKILETGKVQKYVKVITEKCTIPFYFQVHI